MKLWLSKIFILGLALGVMTGLSAIDETFKAGKDTEEQQSEEMKKTEADLDKQIQEVSKRIKDSAVKIKKMVDKDPAAIKASPGQTVFKHEKDWIELEAYTFIQKSYNYTQPVGTARKRMRVYVGGDNISKFETEVVELNFWEQTKYVSKIDHGSPVEGAPNELQLETAFNDGKPYKEKLQNFENTKTNPNRIKFKRDFYVEHLIYFEKLYRFTWDFQKKYFTANDVITIDRLKRSLRY